VDLLVIIPVAICYAANSRLGQRLYDVGVFTVNFFRNARYFSAVILPYKKVRLCLKYFFDLFFYKYLQLGARGGAVG
jgi:hypothetical protein